MRHGQCPQARYAIRSWIANAGMTPEDRIVTVGDFPVWLIQDLHIPGNKHRSGPANVYANVRDACASGLLADQVIVVNDDMFATEPTDPREIVYRSTLREHIARLPQQASWWASSLRLTHNYLRRQGVETPLSYELHRPLLVDTAVMADVLAQAWNGLGIPPQWRTLYGNLAGIGGEQASDGKVVSRANYPSPGPWLSTTAASWSWLENRIAEQFPLASPYEILDADTCV
jgi:hypothetical protein